MPDITTFGELKTLIGRVEVGFNHEDILNQRRKFIENNIPMKDVEIQVILPTLTLYGHKVRLLTE